MHANAYRFVERIAGECHGVETVLEVGSRNINGTVRPLFPGTAYLGVDLHDGPDVDWVGDFLTMPWVPDVADLAVCCEVLEHSPEAEAIVARMLAILRPKGYLIITCAAPDRAPHSALDGGQLRDGEYYRNVLRDELESWVLAHGGQPLIVIHDQLVGDLYCWAKKT